jgi:aryl-alcohol dehydrogenase-like predicted oxidoreductase
MRYGSIPGIDRPVSRIALGSETLSERSQALTDALLEAFLARGGNLVDTANIYCGGGSERAIGAWLRRTGRRKDVLILTKGAHHAPDGTKRVQPHEIAFDLGQSLERLGTPTVDLYLLHRDDPAVPVGEIVDALAHHHAKGRLRAYGASNWTQDRLQAAQDYARERGRPAPAASSPNLSLAVPKEPMWPDCVTVSGDAAALAWYRATGLPLMSWSSQSRGFFSGRFRPDAPDDPEMVRVYYSDANWERYRRARQLAADLGRTPIQIALAWVLSQPHLNTFALIGPRSMEELESSLAAADTELTPEQVAWLNLEG